MSSAPGKELMIRVRDLDITYSTLSRSQGRRWPRKLEKVHALEGVNLDVHRGEAVGFVGRNGAGKSTLLRAIAGICAPTAGEVLVREQPWLLGVHATLMPRLTGAQNIEIGLLSLGLTPEEVAEFTPKVVEFSNLGDALSRPFKTYSSGMKARLQFSVATVKRPKILMLDEALAVGDLHFKRRSLRRLNTLRGNAATILVVSHNTNEISRTCSRVIWMKDGQIVMEGPTEEVIAEYEEEKARDSEANAG